MEEISRWAIWRTPEPAHPIELPNYWLPGPHERRVTPAIAATACFTKPGEATRRLGLSAGFESLSSPWIWLSSGSS